MNKMITIKIATKKDLKELIRLRFLAHQYSAKFDKEVVITDNTQGELTKLVEKELEDPRIIYFLARKNNHAVGIAILSISEEIDQTAFLGELFVEEKYRNQKIGTQLIKEIIRIVRKRGLKVLRVTVAKKNKKAQLFYSKLKFHPKERNYILLEKKL